jgi:hypothetical protein
MDRLRSVVDVLGRVRSRMVRAIPRGHRDAAHDELQRAVLTAHHHHQQAHPTLAVRERVHVRVCATSARLIGRHTHRDFLLSARTYGKIIISEAFMPDHLKTIQPIAIGGLAGGTKCTAHARTHAHTHARTHAMSCTHARTLECGRFA